LKLDEFFSKEIKKRKRYSSPSSGPFFVLHFEISLFSQCSFPQFIIFFSPRSISPLSHTNHIALDIHKEIE
jgi:hypothetical protein